MAAAPSEACIADWSHALAMPALSPAKAGEAIALPIIHTPGPPVKKAVTIRVGSVKVRQSKHRYHLPHVAHTSTHTSTASIHREHPPRACTASMPVRR